MKIISPDKIKANLIADDCKEEILEVRAEFEKLPLSGTKRQVSDRSLLSELIGKVFFLIILFHRIQLEK